MRHSASCSFAGCNAGGIALWKPDGAEGLRMVYQHRPRVLICDVVLPDVTGIQVCRQVRADPTMDGTYIVLATAFDRKERKHRALNAGADEYLNKPYDLEELKARIGTGCASTASRNACSGRR